MRVWLFGVSAALLLAGCSKQTPGPDQPTSPDTKARTGSDVAVSIAPGVALTYAYRYRLPIERVTSVQEQHAAACEALGVERCRVVGMRYAAGPNRTIAAALALRLLPTLARAFGKNATASAVAAGGMLAEASIESIDAGQATRQADAEAASLAADQQGAAQQLESGRGGAVERAALQARVANLQDATRQARQVAADARAKLADTPLSIDYESGAVDPGFTDGPILGALKDGWSNIVSGLATIVLILITLAPWLVVLGMLIVLWSRLRRPLRRMLGLSDEA